MANPRLKGQEISILLIRDGETLDTLTDIRSFEMSFQLEQKDDGFLGETTNRKDSVFNGVTFQMEMHTSNNAVWKLAKDIIDKARRRVPGVKINIKGAFNYPDGTRVRLLIPDAEFGEIPISAGGRGEFITVRLSGSASEARPIL